MNIGEKGWRPTEVHPLAALFPMLDEDDLAALADDIKEHGQRFPILVDQQGRLVDGRNRDRACDIAGKEPRYEVINGEDVEALIWSNNGKRRHMSKGQLAMIAAMDLSETDRSAGADAGISKAARAAGVSRARIHQALLVREHAPHQVAEVISGKITLDKAYADAQGNEREKKWRDDGLAMLRKENKDLAQKVTDRELTLDEARKQLEQQKRDREAMRDSVLIGISSIKALVGFDKSEALPIVTPQLSTKEGQAHLARYFPGGTRELGETIASAKAGLRALEAVHKQIREASHGT